MKHVAQSILKGKFWQVFFCVLSCVTCYMLNASCAFAQQVTLSISPALLEVTIKPGKSVLVAYKLSNLSDPVLIKTQVLPFEPKDTYGNVKIKSEFEGPIRFDLDNADIAFDTPFFLKTNDSQQLLLRIRVPEGAPEGDYYYTLLAETEAPPETGGVTASRAKASIGSNILITVTREGAVDVKGKISFFDVIPHYQLNFFGHKIKIFDSTDKIPLVAMIENTGRNLIQPQGEIVLRGNFGEKAKYAILSQNVLAQSQRLLMAQPSAEVDCEDYSKASFCLRPITLLLSGFFIGRYQLSTTIYFGENSANLYASTSFVSLPLKLILTWSMAILIIFLIVKRYRKEE